MICGIANAVWGAACVPELVRFRRATMRVGETQRTLLRRLLRANAATVFGREHRFATLRSVEDYRAAVPPRTHEELKPWIDRAAGGAPDVLTHDRVRLFEPTSGSTATAKLIPYTGSLQQEFQRGIRAWVADLFLQQPALMGGQAYWSISPRVRSSRCTPGGIPIGFEDDESYLGGWQRRLVRAAMVRPTQPSNDIEELRYRTLLALIGTADLRLISVWSPTFLSLLVERLQEWGDALLRGLGSISPRAEVLRAALRAPTAGECHALLWPRLGLISCWTDANAALPAARLRSLFPQARIQGKGLIATEAFVSFPLMGRDGHALAVRSHFLEFVPVNVNGRPTGESPRLADELESGRRYTVLVSTGGGLYRYRLEDVVEVADHVRECPLIRFVGRQGYVSDWYGEKLNEAHVARVLHASFDVAAVEPEFAMLACDTSLPAYVLYVEAPASDELLRRVADRIDQELRLSFHYEHARFLGQLGPVRVFRAERAAESYVAAAIRAGQPAGGVKTQALDRCDGWSRTFRGRLLAEPGSVGSGSARLADPVCGLSPGQGPPGPG